MCIQLKKKINDETNTNQSIFPFFSFLLRIYHIYMKNSKNI